MIDVKTAIPAWPRFEDGELVRFGDEVLDMSNHGFVVHSVHFYEWGVVLSSGHGYGVRTRGTAVRPTPDQMADYYAKWPKEKANSATPGVRACKIIGSSTNNLMYPDHMAKWYELSCGHSVTLKGSEPPRVCPICEAKLVFCDISTMTRRSNG